MAGRHNPSDINKKLKNLTPEQAKAFGAALGNSNAVYTNAEKARSAKKSPAKKSGK